MPSGAFVYWIAEDRWEWSEGMFHVHGFEPGEVVPTTELVLSHKHPEDLASVSTILGKAFDEGRGFVCQHRIIDARRREHTVISFGFPERDGAGSVHAVRGVVADISEQVAHETREAADAAVRGATATRAIIDQAKGCLMARYGLSPDEAFGVLRAVSNHTNRKLHDLAAAIVDLLAAPPDEHAGPDRAVHEVEAILQASDEAAPQA